ncbi:MAG TPA: glycosyltransferase [Actinomycetes bacterium]|jgi:GT2 family glycosyltransferase|nr:glycosyltransferase [Actinomycetes bacterium]
MSYRIADVEVTQPLPTLRLGGDEDGLAVLFRRNGRPLDFQLIPLAPGAILGPERLSAAVATGAGVRLLESSLRVELAGPLEPSARLRLSVTVAICTRDRPADLHKCLASVLALRDGDNPADLEVLVVDNAPSTAATRELVASLPGIRYTLEPRPGLDFARNRALHEAAGEVVAFLDDDVRADRGWLAGLMEALGEHPDAACVTGLVLPAELATRAQLLFERRGGFRRGFDKLRYSGSELESNRLYPTGAGIFGVGCNMAFRRQVMLDLGEFDNALDTGPPLPGGGDLDAFYRVVRAGQPLVYEPRMLVFHRHRRDLDSLRRQYRSWGTGFMAFVAKCWGADPSQRAKLARLVAWWCNAQLRELRSARRDGDRLRRRMVTAELLGGFAGLAGGYRRSRRRVAAIRRTYP